MQKAWQRGTLVDICLLNQQLPVDTLLAPAQQCEEEVCSQHAKAGSTGLLQILARCNTVLHNIAYLNFTQGASLWRLLSYDLPENNAVAENVSFFIAPMNINTACSHCAQGHDTPGLLFVNL